MNNAIADIMQAKVFSTSTEKARLDKKVNSTVMLKLPVVQSSCIVSFIENTFHLFQAHRNSTLMGHILRITAEEKLVKNIAIVYSGKLFDSPFSMFEALSAPCLASKL